MCICEQGFRINGNQARDPTVINRSLFFLSPRNTDFSAILKWLTVSNSILKWSTCTSPSKQFHQMVPHMRPPPKKVRCPHTCGQAYSNLHQEKASTDKFEGQKGDFPTCKIIFKVFKIIYRMTIRWVSRSPTITYIKSITRNVNSTSHHQLKI